MDILFKLGFFVVSLLVYCFVWYGIGRVIGRLSDGSWKRTDDHELYLFAGLLVTLPIIIVLAIIVEIIRFIYY